MHIYLKIIQGQRRGEVEGKKEKEKNLSANRSTAPRGGPGHPIAARGGTVNTLASRFSTGFITVLFARGRQRMQIFPENEPF